MYFVIRLLMNEKYYKLAICLIAKAIINSTLKEATKLKKLNCFGKHI